MNSSDVATAISKSEDICFESTYLSLVLYQPVLVPSLS
jgi:hypothetical protein